MSVGPEKRRTIPADIGRWTLIALGVLVSVSLVLFAADQIISRLLSHIY